MHAGMALLGSLTRLSELHCGCKEPGTDASLSALQNLSALTALIFIPQPDGPSIGRKGLESIAHLTNLRRHVGLCGAVCMCSRILLCFPPRCLLGSALCGVAGSTHLVACSCATTRTCWSVHSQMAMLQHCVLLEQRYGTTAMQA